MPPAEDILRDLTEIANEWRPLAIGWHVLLGTLVLALLAGWRPSHRLAGYLVAAPCASVSALAWLSGNPFNGVAFAVLTALLVAVASRLSTAPVQIVSSLFFVPGALLVVFGWVYPHFLEVDRWTAYTYSAPFGLLPCPTLSALLGVALIVGLARSKWWSGTLAAAGVVYGAIGAFRLGVALDFGLLAGAGVLVAAMIHAPTMWRSVRASHDERTRPSRPA